MILNLYMLSNHIAFTNSTQKSLYSSLHFRFSKLFHFLVAGSPGTSMIERNKCRINSQQIGESCGNRPINEWMERRGREWEKHVARMDAHSYQLKLNFIRWWQTLENRILMRIFYPRRMRMGSGEGSTMRNFIVCTVHLI